jgi:5-methylcytosine-specific restriction protein A
MPSLRSVNPCRKHLCNAMQTANGYCDAHQQAHFDESAERYAKNAARTRKRYGFNPYNTKQWKRTRDAVIAMQQGLCQECLIIGIYTPFDEIDHIVSVAQSEPTLAQFCDLSNLQCLCIDCHRIKTAKERHR